MNKWVAYEYAQHQTLEAPNSKSMDSLEKELLKLYIQSLETIGLIFKRFKKTGPNFISQSRMPEIERKLSELDRIDKGCTSIKDEIDADLKSKETVGKLIRWIKDENDPEPSHEGFMEQTGLQNDTLAADWFLRTSEFTSFEEKLSQDHDGQIFRLNGMMGSGKTTLICRVISHFQRFPIPGLRVVHYYCYGSTASDGPPGISYQTVIRGLCSKMAWNNDSGKLSQSARDLYRKCHPTEGDRKPTDGEWKQLLKDLVTESKTLLIVDALDECRFPDHNDFLKSIRDLWKHQRLNVIFSSRPQIDAKMVFGQEFVDYQVATTEATDDMGRFIERKISEIKDDHFRSNSILFKNKDLNERLVGALNNHAGSMFRWVEVWLGVLFPHDPIAQSDVAKSKLEILESAQTLKELGDEADLMNNAYRQLWKTNARDERRRCHQTRVFRFVLGALDSMTPQMLLQAICFDPEQPANYSCELDIDYIEKLYHNFLTLKDGVLVFEHVSAKAFILELDGQENAAPNFANGALNHGVIAKTSLLLLQDPKHTIWVGSGINWDKYPRTMDQSQFLCLRIGEHPFEPSEYELMPRVIDRSLGTYVVRNWYRHCSHLMESDLDPVLSRELSCLWLRIFADFPITLKSLWHPFEDSRAQFNMLHDSIVKADNQVMVDPLMFTLSLRVFPFRRGDGFITDVAKTLENIMAQNLEGETALHIAVRQRGLHSFKALLEISLQLNQGGEFLMAQNPKGETALLAAVQQKSFQVVEALLEISLEKGFEREFLMAQTLKGETALHIAVQQKNFQFVEALLETSLKTGFGREFLYAKGHDGRNVLHCGGSDGVVKAILHFEAKITQSPATTGAMSCQKRLLESEDDRGRSPMIEIMMHRSEECVLFIYGDQYVTLNHLPETRQIQLLGLAIRRGFSKVTKFFVDQGADVNAIGGNYGTALGAAAANGHLEIAELLIKRGADVNTIVGDYGTALGAAAWRGHLEMAKLLIERDADVNAIGGKYGSALAAATWEGNLEMAKFLVDQGADINAVVGEYGTALMIAALKNHRRLVGLLLTKGANVNAVGGLYGTALGAAISQDKGHVTLSGYLEMYSNLLKIDLDYGLAVRKLPSARGWAEVGERHPKIASAWARYGQQ
ncbi:hypothetical protein E8E14_014068 [Neopestalotiopsis sp. 37M]|nr:hypothetical protein E8E14_014068 [Neopestalotiopsis sp. 37M]